MGQASVTFELLQSHLVVLSVTFNWTNKSYTTFSRCNTDCINLQRKSQVNATGVYAWLHCDHLLMMGQLHLRYPQGSAMYPKCMAGVGHAVVYNRYSWGTYRAQIKIASERQGFAGTKPQRSFIKLGSAVRLPC